MKKILTLLITIGGSQTAEAMHKSHHVMHPCERTAQIVRKNLAADEVHKFYQFPPLPNKYVLLKKMEEQYPDAEHALWQYEDILKLGLSEKDNQWLREKGLDWTVEDMCRDFNKQAINYLKEQKKENPQEKR